MSSQKKVLKNGEPPKKHKAVARFVDCCALLSGPDWKIDKKILVPADGSDKPGETRKHCVTVPPCTDVKAKYKIIVCREGGYKLCILALLKLKVHGDKPVECDVTVSVFLDGILIGTIVIPKDVVNQDPSCIKLCKCFDILKEDLGKKITFEVSSPCLDFKVDEDCSCELFVPATPTDHTTPDVVCVRDFDVSDCKNTKHCGKGCDLDKPKYGVIKLDFENKTPPEYWKEDLKKFIIEVEDTIENPCKKCKGTKVKNLVRLETEDGCLLDCASTRLRINCCFEKVKIVPPVVKCNDRWS